jgi:hypothetical protein
MHLAYRADGFPSMHTLGKSTGDAPAFDRKKEKALVLPYECKTNRRSRSVLVVSDRSEKRVPHFADRRAL